MVAPSRKIPLYSASVPRGTSWEVAGHSAIFRDCHSWEIVEYSTIFRDKGLAEHTIVSGYTAIFRYGFSRNIPASRSITLYSATDGLGNCRSRAIYHYIPRRGGGRTFWNRRVLHYIPRRIDRLEKQKKPRSARPPNGGDTDQLLRPRATLGQQTARKRWSFRADNPPTLPRMYVPLRGSIRHCHGFWSPFGLVVKRDGVFAPRFNERASARRGCAWRGREPPL